jgi:hypothetical protein
MQHTLLANYCTYLGMQVSPMPPSSVQESKAPRLLVRDVLYNYCAYFKVPNLVVTCLDTVGFLAQ